MKTEQGKITECTDAELFDHWLKHFDSMYAYEEYKGACIAKGVKIVPAEDEMRCPNCGRIAKKAAMKEFNTGRRIQVLCPKCMKSADYDAAAFVSEQGEKIRRMLG